MKDFNSHTSLSRPWARPHEEILKELGVSIEHGLDSEQEVRERQRRFGRNRMTRAGRKSVWRILLNQFESLIIVLLAAAAAISFFLREWVDGAAITVAIIFNTLIGFISELKAARSMEALQELGTTMAKVRRDGEIREVSSEEIVPGDIVAVRSGDMVPADIRLIHASGLQVNESPLTGESFPVEKSVQAVEEDSPLGDRSSMLHKGTSVTKGSGEGVVVAIGMDTEVGNIASLAKEAEEEITPLEKRLNRLGKELVYAIAIVVLLVLAVGVFRGQPIFLMYKIAVALAVAAIPEGLPIVATIALARGMWRMARQNALVNRLSAVETLGATTVIFTDKTGTLTENQMTLTRLVLDSGQVTVQGRGEFASEGSSADPGEQGPLREILEVGMLCNNASYEEGEDGGAEKAVGDPVEIALLSAGLEGGLSRSRLLESFPREREEPFDSVTKKMATFHRDGDRRYRVAVKGAPEEILKASSKVRTGGGARELSEEDRRNWSEHNRKLAEEGLRVLALATKTVDSIESVPYEDLTLLGLVGLWDPPREEIKEAIASCRKAGIRVVMVTGDHAITARKVGLAVGLVDGRQVRVRAGKDIEEPDTISARERRRLLNVPIFARVSPKQKLDLVKLHQEHGSIVAMTGDGVNDAPALKKANIGVAMGRRGTQVAREAADIVLLDDAFATIVHAVEMGRIIFANIRKFVVYLLSGNVSEIMIVSVALLAGAPLPILPLQILYLNMLSDVFPALALGVGKGSRSVMKRKPRDPREPVMTRSHWIATGGYSVLIASAVLGAFALAFHWLHMDEKQAVTVSFLTLAFARLWHVFNMREPDLPFFKNDVVGNPFVWGALALCTALLLIAVYTPYLASVLKLTQPGFEEWGLILASSLIPLVVGQLLKLILPRRLSSY